MQTKTDLHRFIDEQSANVLGDDPYRDVAFTADEYARRQASLRAAMATACVDVMLVSAPDTLAWLHGYRSRWYRQHTSTALPPTQCTVIDAAGEALFMIDAAYHAGLVTSTSIVDDVRTVPGGDMTHEPGLDAYVRFLADQVRTASTRPLSVGLELWSCVPCPAVSGRIEHALETAGHRVVDMTRAARRLRLRKSPAEIVMIEKAQRACDAGLLALRDQLKPGMTELEAWAVYVSASVAAGGEPAALHEIVASGVPLPNLHRLSSHRRLKQGIVFHADAASSYFGYHARSTRPYMIGPAASELKELTTIAGDARDVLIDVGTVGTPWQDLFAALREYYRSTGIAGSAGGYELGITVPPADWVNEFAWSIDNDSLDGVIEAGTVTNFETWNIVAVVDTVVFGEDTTRILSSVPAELIEVNGSTS